MSKLLAPAALLLWLSASMMPQAFGQKPAAPAAPAQDPAAPAAAAATPAAAATAEPELSPAHKAVFAVADAFTKAFNEGDAKAISALFVEDAEILREDEDPIKGRKAIQTMFEETFADSPGATIELQDSTVRFLTPQLAVEEGVAVITPAPSEDGDQDEPSRSRYTVHYAKVGDAWLQASVRDKPDLEPTVEERLQQLEWLVGDWVDEGQNGLVETTCKWDASGKYLLREYKSKLNGEALQSGSERIGWDPLSKQIKSWMFDSEGGYGEALWTQSGDQWILKAKGVLPDGRIASATRSLVFVSKDMYRVNSTDRVAGGATRPDREDIVMVRKPPAPAAARTPAAEPAKAPAPKQ